MWKGYAPNSGFLKRWGRLAKVSLPSIKWEGLGPKTFDLVFIGHDRNSVAYIFKALNSFCISEFRDKEFFDHVFPLKKNVFIALHENMAVHENVNLFAFRSSVMNLEGVKDLGLRLVLVLTLLSPF